jgi:hypothetical protein
MGSLGKRGTQRDAVDLDFDYFGVTIRVHPDATDLDVADLMESAGDMDLDDEEGAREVMGSMSRFMRGQIHPDDRELFWRTAKANRQQLKDIIDVARTITQAVAELASGFPTGQPSGSPSTTANTSKKSRGGTSSEARAERRRAAAATSRGRRATDEAMGLLEGRPDLKLALARQVAAEQGPASA